MCEQKVFHIRIHMPKALLIVDKRHPWSFDCLCFSVWSIFQVVRRDESASGYSYIYIYIYIYIITEYTYLLNSIFTNTWWVHKRQATPGYHTSCTIQYYFTVVILIGTISSLDSSTSSHYGNRYTKVEPLDWCRQSQRTQLRHCYSRGHSEHSSWQTQYLHLSLHP